jgi:hypothetical protein
MQREHAAKRQHARSLIQLTLWAQARRPKKLESSSPIQPEYITLYGLNAVQPCRERTGKDSRRHM